MTFVLQSSQFESTPCNFRGWRTGLRCTTKTTSFSSGIQKMVVCLFCLFCFDATLSAFGLLFMKRVLNFMRNPKLAHVLVINDTRERTVISIKYMCQIIYTVQSQCRTVM